MNYRTTHISGISLAVLVLITGCGKEPSSAHNSSQYNFPIYSSPQAEELKSELKNAPLTCAASPCPDNVGLIAMVVAKDSYGVQKSIGQCTGFLIAKNTVATNAHCLTGIPSSETDCSSVVAIKFPSSSMESADSFSCKRILRQSDLSARIDAPDYAYFEIEPTTRKPVSVSKSGVADQAQLHVWKVDPSSGRLGGTLTREWCTSVQNSILNFRFTSDWSETGLALGCTGINGNSGSPVFDTAANSVVGILQSRKLEAYLSLVKESFSGLIDPFPSELHPHFVFTNLSCVPSAGSDEETAQIDNSAACEQARRDGVISSRMEEKMTKSASAILGAKINAWSERLPKLAVFEISLGKSRSARLIATPSCLRPLSDWPKEIVAGATESGMLWWKKTKFKAIYDAGLVIETRLKPDPFLRFTDQFDATEKSTAYEMKITLSEDNRVIEEVASRPLHPALSSILLPWSKVRWCSESELKTGNTVSTQTGPLKWAFKKMNRA